MVAYVIPRDFKRDGSNKNVLCRRNALHTGAVSGNISAASLSTFY